MDNTNPNYVKITDYIERNPAGVLSTIGPEGAHGAVVYIIPASYGTVCFVTKNDTQKFANLKRKPDVSLTFFNEHEGTTLQISGEAFVADNQDLRQVVMDKMADAHKAMADWLPPVTRLTTGEYVVVGIEVKHARLMDFRGLGVSGPAVVEV